MAHSQPLLQFSLGRIQMIELQQSMFFNNDSFSISFIEFFEAYDFPISILIHCLTIDVIFQHFKVKLDNSSSLFLPLSAGYCLYCAASIFSMLFSPSIISLNFTICHKLSCSVHSSINNGLNEVNNSNPHYPRVP